jgi:hypothetical protein
MKSSVGDTTTAAMPQLGPGCEPGTQLLYNFLSLGEPTRASVLSG